jgi:hypothetical protein
MSRMSPGQIHDVPDTDGILWTPSLAMVALGIGLIVWPAVLRWWRGRTRHRHTRKDNGSASNR